MPNILEPQTKYTMYYLEGCPYSMKAEALLKLKNIEYIKKTDLNMEQLKEKFGSSATFPRIYNSDSKFIGGYTELSEIMN